MNAPIEMGTPGDKVIQSGLDNLINWLNLLMVIERLIMFGC